jgi:CubicO group peptidase (beta-lactamase class C family)
MILRLVVLAGALLLSTAPICAQRGASAPATRPVAYLSAAQLKELDTHIEQARQQWRIPGLAIAIVQRDSVVFAKGYGVKELGKPAAVDENTLFAIGSSGKSMTAAVVSMLVDEGKMRLDDQIWRYLPNFRWPIPT